MSREPRATPEIRMSAPHAATRSTPSARAHSGVGIEPARQEAEPFFVLSHVIPLSRSSNPCTRSGRNKMIRRYCPETSHRLTFSRAAKTSHGLTFCWALTWSTDTQCGPATAASKTRQQCGIALRLTKRPCRCWRRGSGRPRLPTAPQHPSSASKQAHRNHRGGSRPHGAGWLFVDATPYSNMRVLSQAPRSKGKCEHSHV